MLGHGKEDGEPRKRKGGHGKHPGRKQGGISPDYNASKQLGRTNPISDMYLARLEKLEAEGKMAEIEALEKELAEMAQK